MVSKEKFSVIIPTLQKSSELPKIVDICEENPLVGEVIIINNAQKELELVSTKLRILQQTENLFVNPAWNLGAKEAKYDLLAIVNDDVLFEPVVFDVAFEALNSGKYGIVGPDKTSFTHVWGKPRVVFARETPTVDGFGTFMCLKRKDFIQIPNNIKIWGGDDWLVMIQNRPPGAFLGVRFETEMSTTSASPEFQKIRAEEQRKSLQILNGIKGKKWWHRPFHVYNVLRIKKDILRAKIKI